MIRFPGFHFRSSLFLSGIAALLLASSCNRDKEIIEINPRYSYNVAKVPSWFPSKKHPLTTPEREVFQRYGKPDFIHFWWKTDGTFITSSDLAGKRDEIPTMVNEARKTWVYMERKIEVEFKGPNGYVEHPATEKTLLICQYGDPTRKSDVKTDNQGRSRETWIWMDQGVKIDFVDNLEIKRYNFQGAGQGTDLIK